MNLQPKLILSFGLVAVITLAVSLIGLWQASRLADALYEIGVVRLPSLEGLDAIREGKALLDGAARVLAAAPASPAVRAAEAAVQERGWALTGRGRALYEPLPQTTDEAAAWREFVSAWNEWSAAYSIGPPDAATLRARSERVDRLLDRLTAINLDIAANVKADSVARRQDVSNIRRLMLLAAGAGFLGALGVGWLLGRRVSAPLVKLSARVHQIAGGDFAARVAVSSTDEVGRLARAVNDMSERMRDALRKSEDKFAKVFRSAPIGFLITRYHDGRFVEANDEFLKIFGFDRDAVIGKTSLDIGLWPDAASRAEMQGRLQTSSVTIQHAQRLRAKNGDLRTVRAATLLMEADGETLIVSAMIDVTERLRLERQLAQAQKMEAVGRLAGGVAHDFNNLLTVISGFTDLATTHLPDDHPAQGDLVHVRKAADSAANLTRQLLAFSRRQVLHPKVLNLNQVVESARGLLTRLIGADVHLRTSLDPTTGQVRADAGQLEQVIMNLAVNARDAMPGGGTLTLATACAEYGRDDRIDFPDAEPGPYALLTVTDTGTGMSEATRARIFEPFFTTKPEGKGTGLGLATVFGIVKQSGGYVRVDSQPGEGTTFRIALPQVDAPATGAIAAEEAPARGHETVLVADDEPGVRAIVRQSLERLGYRVLEAPSGTTALEVAAAFPAEIHLLLTDVMMPDMRGPALAARLSADRPQTRVLFMSGHTDEAVLGPGILDRQLGYLEKPFSFESLARRVRDVLDRKLDEAR